MTFQDQATVSETELVNQDADPLLKKGNGFEEKNVQLHRPAPPAPVGAKPGGVWGTLRYNGPITQVVVCFGCLMCGVPGLVGVCCVLAFGECDTKDVYKVDGKLFDETGKYAGAYGQVADKFTAAKPQVMRRE